MCHVGSLSKVRLWLLCARFSFQIAKAYIRSRVDSVATVLRWVLLSTRLWAGVGSAVFWMCLVCGGDFSACCHERFGILENEWPHERRGLTSLTAFWDTHDQNIDITWKKEDYTEGKNNRHYTAMTKGLRTVCHKTNFGKLRTRCCVQLLFTEKTPKTLFLVWWLKCYDIREESASIVSQQVLRQDPPLDLSFWSFLTFLHHGIEEIERHLLWKFYKKIRRKSWSNVPP